MKEMARKIKEAIAPPPVTQEWIDMVAGVREEKAQKVEKAKGPVAAEKHRAATRKMVGRMERQGIIPSADS